MRLVLSRKGFDATSGGGPSPILPDGRLAPLPIPDAGAPLRYDELRVAGHCAGDLVAALARGRVRARDRAHLDPDVDATARPRRPGWRPAFGQAGAAQGHLRRRGVGPGDLFLFFGWFRATEASEGRLRFARGAPDLHVLFAWLEVERVVPVAGLSAAERDWAAEHPHLHGVRRGDDTLYVARPGRAGLFSRLHPDLVLSGAPGRAGRSAWRLPAWFDHRGRRSVLSHHEDPRRWRRDGGHVWLRAASRGQEFVLDLEDYPEGKAWAWERVQIGRASGAEPRRSRELTM